MRKTLIFMLLCSLAAAANLSGIGCYERGTGQWYCPQDTKVFDLTARFEDVICFSSKDNVSCTGADCADQLDMGCYSPITVSEPRVIEICSSFVNSTYAERSKECDNYTLDTEGSYIASVNPAAIDFSACTKYYDENGLFTANCSSYAGRSFRFDAIITGEGDFIIPAMEEARPASIADLLSENAAYIALAAVAAALAFMVLRPRQRKLRR